MRQVLFIAMVMFSSTATLAQEADPADPVENAESAAGRVPEAAPKLPEPEGATRLSPKFDVWIDAKRGVVFVDGQVCLRRGMLEMFSCTRNTKEHESIVSANAQAFLVHAALLRLGAEVGHPVQFLPAYKPPAGTQIDIDVEWRDANGKQQSAKAQDWIRDLKTGKAMEHVWVFAGSRFWTDEETGKQYYQAEGGDFICVSNFGTAMLDLPIKSSQSNEDLEFEALTEKIPPLGTPVRMVLKPVLKEGVKGESGGGKEE